MSLLEGPEVGCQIPWELGDRWVYSQKQTRVLSVKLHSQRLLSRLPSPGRVTSSKGRDRERVCQCPAASYAILGAWTRNMLSLELGLSSWQPKLPIEKAFIQQVRCGPVCIKNVFSIDSFSVTSLS